MFDTGLLCSDQRLELDFETSDPPVPHMERSKAIIKIAAKLSPRGDQLLAEIFALSFNSRPSFLEDAALHTHAVENEVRRKIRRSNERHDSHDKAPRRVAPVAAVWLGQGDAQRQLPSPHTVALWGHSLVCEMNVTVAGLPVDQIRTLTAIENRRCRMARSPDYEAG